MSRRPPTTADRTEQNRATLKTLAKLEPNKSCADCKRNKHPRWASWNIGIFLCIRCSGIHRGMGTHISRVKSVDLDSWTDEQVASMLRWGNARANKYWEHKLAEGHVPNEAKIENFIKTKYDSRRWVMDGPVPDPATLDDGMGGAGDDDVPLNVVREKAIERSGSLRNGQAAKAKPQVDLFGDAGEETAPVRPSTTEPAVQRPGSTSKAAAAPPKQTRPGESLLGLDFFGGSSSAPPARPSSTGASTPGVPGRADLKSSILSLYASKPAAPPQPQQQQQQQQPQSNIDAFGGMQSPPLASPSQQPSNSQNFGGLNDAFSSLSFGSPQQQSQPQQTQSKPSAFSNLTSPTNQPRQTSSKSALSGGSFFDSKPTSIPTTNQTSPPPPPKPTTTSTHARTESFGFGDFSSATVSPPLPVPSSSAKSPPANTSSMGDLFDMSSPAAAPAPAPIPVQVPPQQPTYATNSAFNLSQPVVPAKPAAPALSNFSSMNSTDAWGSNDAWASPDPPPQTTASTTSPPIQTSTFKPTVQTQTSAFDSGWGDVASPSTKSGGGGGGGGFSVQQDEEFGGWSHASPVATSATNTSSAGGARQGGGGGAGFGGGGGTDDLFGNVWE